MRALFFTTGGDSEPSSRVRVYQYLEPLRRSGIACARRRSSRERGTWLGMKSHSSAWPIFWSALSTFPFPG